MSYNKSPFENAPDKSVQLSYFDRSHEYVAQMKPGYLYPVLTQETLPNDIWKIYSEFMFWFQPLWFPVIGSLTMRCDYFYIPNRILWPGNDLTLTNSGWKEWIAMNNEQTPPLCSPDMTLDTDNWSQHVMAYMGIPYVKAEPGVRETVIQNLNAFPPSAYLAIWDEYYRNPQLEGEKWFALHTTQALNTNAFSEAYQGNEAPIVDYWPVLPAKWRKDYFTSGTPQPQVGGAIVIPTVGKIFNDTEGEYEDDNSVFVTNPGDGVPSAGPLAVDTFGVVEDDTGVKLKLKATVTIRQVREAEAYQSFYERLMKVGQRYRDMIKGFWGRDPEPGTVDVPVLIGSVFGQVQVSTTMSQATTTYGDTTQVVGDYRGNMALYKHEKDQMEYHCREHGWIMAILQVNPATSYGQGIHRMWRRDVQTDYALDMFAHIGDQEVLNEEVYYRNKIDDMYKNKITFNYLDRFGEYKYMNDIFIGYLASDYQQAKQMHIGRIWDDTDEQFETEFGFNSEFITSGKNFLQEAYDGGEIRETDIWRTLPITAVTAAALGWIFTAHIHHSISVMRSLPTFSTPDLT